MSQNDFSYHKRACSLALKQVGFNLHSHEYKCDKDRWVSWLAESLLSGFHFLESGEIKIALRCALQVREYLGRVGGFWPNPTLHDAYIELQNQIENRIAG